MKKVRDLLEYERRLSIKIRKGVDEEEKINRCGERRA